MESYGIEWNQMESNGITWYHMESHRLLSTIAQKNTSTFFPDLMLLKTYEKDSKDCTIIPGTL